MRHRQTKGAETDRPILPPPRHIPTLPKAAVGEARSITYQAVLYGYTPLVAARPLDRDRSNSVTRMTETPAPAIDAVCACVKLLNKVILLHGAGIRAAEVA